MSGPLYYPRPCPRGSTNDFTHSSAALSLYCWIAPAGSTCFGQTRVHSPTNVHPRCLRMREQPQPLLRSLITVVHVVALPPERAPRVQQTMAPIPRPDKRIAQRAIDAHAELFIEIQLLRSLQEFARAQRWLVLADQPRALHFAT